MLTRSRSSRSSTRSSDSVVLIALLSEGPLGQLKLPLQLVVFPLGKSDPLGLDLGEGLG